MFCALYKWDETKIRKLIELASGNTMSEHELCEILSKVGLCI